MQRPSPRFRSVQFLLRKRVFISWRSHFFLIQWLFRSEKCSKISLSFDLHGSSLGRRVNSESRKSLEIAALILHESKNSGGSIILWFEFWWRQMRTSSYVGLIVGRMFSSVLLGVVLRRTIGEVIWYCMPSWCCLPLYSAASVMFKFSDHQTVRKMVRALPPVGVGTYYGIPQSRSLYCFFFFCKIIDNLLTHLSIVRNRLLFSVYGTAGQ